MGAEFQMIGIIVPNLVLVSQFVQFCHKIDVICPAKMLCVSPARFAWIFELLHTYIIWHSSTFFAADFHLLLLMFSQGKDAFDVCCGCGADGIGT